MQTGRAGQAEFNARQHAWLLGRHSAASLADRLPSDLLVQELRVLNGGVLGNKSTVVLVDSVET